MVTEQRLSYVDHRQQVSDLTIIDKQNIEWLQIKFIRDLYKIYLSLEGGSCYFYYIVTGGPTEYSQLFDRIGEDVFCNE